MATSDIASPVIGIMGAGISIGLLAHTARNVAHMTDDLYRPRRRRHSRPSPQQLRSRRRTRPGQYNPYGFRF